MSNIDYNTNGTIIAVSSFTNTVYKVLFFVMQENKSWNFINYIDMTSPDAGIFMVMNSDIKYLFVSNSTDNIALYANDDQSSPSTSFNFTEKDFGYSNIGTIDDVKRNNDCSIVLFSSSTGNNSDVINGTITCYAQWSPSGYPDILMGSIEHNRLLFH